MNNAKHIAPAPIIPCATPTNKYFKNLTGLRFGRLLVLELVGKKLERTRKTVPVFFWRCVCDCGNIRIISGISIKHGATKSCGCLMIETNTARMTTHGMSFSVEHRAWRHMIQRCTNPNDAGYSNYGGRGIKVCERWLNSFENFLADMGKKPSAELSLERQENDGDYEPSNCVWDTKKEQTRNTRRTRFVTFNGETLCLAEWGERFGLTSPIISGRLRLGWSFEKAISEPINKDYSHPKTRVAAL